MIPCWRKLEEESTEADDGLAREVEDVDDFYEDDEPLARIAAAFERGQQSRTAPRHRVPIVTPPVSRTMTNGGTVRIKDVRVTLQPQTSYAHERVNSPR